MKKLSALILLLSAAACSVQALTLRPGLFPEELIAFGLDKTLYCPYFEKEYFNPEPEKVASNGIKALLVLDPYSESYLEFNGCPTRYVVLENEEGKRFIGAADYSSSQDLFFPRYGYLDGKLEYYSLDENFNYKPKPAKVDGHWLLEPGHFTGRFTNEDPFSPILYRQHLTLAPGKSEARLVTSITAVTNQEASWGKPGGHGRGDRKITVTTGGYRFHGEVNNYSPVSSNYDPATGTLNISCPAAISRSDSEFYPILEDGRRGDAAWEAYCKADINKNPDVQDFKAQMVGRNPKELFLLGDHKMEVMSTDPSGTKWMALRRITPISSRDDFDCYTMWHEDGAYTFGEANLALMLQYFNEVRSQYFKSFGGTPGTLNPNYKKDTNRQLQAQYMPYMISACVAVLRENPGITPDDPKFEQAIARNLKLRQGKKLKDLFTEFNDDIYARLAELPYIIGIKADPNPIPFSGYKVELTLEKDGMQWKQPLKFEYTDVSTKPITSDVRIDPAILFNFSEPKPYDVADNRLPSVMIDMMNDGSKMLRKLKPGASVPLEFTANEARIMEDMQWIAANPQLIDPYRLRPRVVNRWEFYNTIKTLYDAQQTLKENDKIIETRAKKLKAVANVWKSYRKRTQPEPVSLLQKGSGEWIIEDADSHTATHRRLVEKQRTFMVWLDDVLARGAEEQYKNFTDADLQKILAGK